MEMRQGFIPRGLPRDRGGLIRHGFPLRGRGVMLMDRVRLAHPRPALMRGGLPPFVGRGMLPPARPRGLGPGMMSRPPPLPPPPLPPPPGPLGPLGPRGLMPRPILPPRLSLPDATDVIDAMNINVPTNGLIKNNNREKEVNSQNKANQTQNNNQQIGNRVVKGGKTNRNNKGNQQNMGQQQQAGVNKKNRKDNKNRRINVSQQSQQPQSQQTIQIPTQPPVQASHQTSLQNVHIGSHPLQQPPSQQNVVCINQSSMQKHMSTVQPQVNTNIQSQPQQLSLPQPTVRGGRADMNHRNASNAHMVNRSALNVPLHGNVASVPPRGNTIMNGPPPVQYSTAPPSTYVAPPPIITQQMPIKRSAPPVGPPVMQPKRIRYEPPVPANSFTSYQQQPPPPQQSIYSTYEVPQPTDMYNSAPPSNFNMVSQQGYVATDYNNYQVSTPQVNTSFCGNVNSQYSTSYNSSGTYPTYVSSSGYEPILDYSSVTVPQTSTTDPYAYSKPVSTVDSYGYTNSTYTTPQIGYEDYSAGYVDQSGYSQTVQDQSYDQSVGTYPTYSY